MFLVLASLLTLLVSSFALIVPFKASVAGFITVLSFNSNTIFSKLEISPEISTSTTTTLLLSKDDLPALDKCFNAVRKELSADGESLQRLKKDIVSHDYKDVIAFTREYDAGFRGGVLKSAWKQMGDAKKRGIEVSNSFTFDLIALNKAARVEDEVEALRCLGLVRQDLVDFLALEPQATGAGKQ